MVDETCGPTENPQSLDIMTKDDKGQKQSLTIMRSSCLGTFVPTKCCLLAYAKVLCLLTKQKTLWNSNYPQEKRNATATEFKKLKIH